MTTSANTDNTHQGTAATREGWITDTPRLAQTGHPGASPETPRTYTVEQVAGILGISRSTAYECVRLGTLPALRFRRRIVIPASSIERLLDGAGSIVDEALEST